MAGTVDFVSVEPSSATGLSERLAELATEEALAQAGIGSHGRFPGPAVPRGRAGRSRMAAAPRSRPRRRRQRLSLRRPAARRRRRQVPAPIIERFMFGSVATASPTTFGTKGSPISLSTACASGATAIQLGVEAIRRGETDAALCVGDRRLGEPRSPRSASRCSRRCRPRTIRRRRPPAVLQEPRRLRDGRRRRRAGAGELRSRARRAARRSSA